MTKCRIKTSNDYYVQYKRMFDIHDEELLLGNSFPRGTLPDMHSQDLSKQFTLVYFESVKFLRFFGSFYYDFPECGKHPNIFCILFALTIHIEYTVSYILFIPCIL